MKLYTLIYGIEYDYHTMIVIANDRFEATKFAREYAEIHCDEYDRKRILSNLSPDSFDEYEIKSGVMIDS